MKKLKLPIKPLTDAEKLRLIKALERDLRVPMKDRYRPGVN